MLVPVPVDVSAELSSKDADGSRLMGSEPDFGQFGSVLYRFFSSKLGLDIEPGLN